MKRRLVWTCVGLVALGAAWVLALWPEPTSHDGSPHAGAPVLAAPSTPAAPPSPPVDPGAQGGPFLGGQPAPVVPSPADLGAPDAVGARASAADRAALVRADAGAIEKRRAEHEQRIARHRREVVERANKKREQLEQKRARMRAERAAFQSRRAPDPNRPPPEIPTLELGPPVIPDPWKNAP